MFLRNYLKCISVLACICLVLVINAHGQSAAIPKELYTESGIPDSLREGANSVVRYSTDDCNVKGPGRLSIKHHSIITVLNEKGDQEAQIRYHYNRKYDTYSYIDIHVYDKNGKNIKKYHKGDMYEGAAYSDETLVSDDRILALRHAITDYPETIEIEYEENYTSFIGLGAWYIQDEEQSIQRSTYSISIANDAGFRYFNKNNSLLPEKKSSDKIDTYTWTASNLKGFKLEESAMAWRTLPVIEFTQNKFDFYGNPGDISTWQNYGKWQQALNSDVCTLSPQRVAELRKMTDTCHTEKDKAKLLYKYLQTNMRYVSIQLGIGGLKPFPATFVDEKKYGDCKALSNYMYAMLQAVGIKSYYAKINAGANAEPADFTFPFDYSNHIILCVPFKNDTTWLECTSNNAQFGKLGSFTENRNALLITEDGGKLINTPKSVAADNQFNSEVHIVLQPDGGAKAQMKISSIGEIRALHIAVEGIKIDEQKQFWLERLGIKQPSVFELEPGKDENYTKQININLEYDKFCDVMAGDKQFYKPAVFKLWSPTPPVLEKRKTDFYWEYPEIKSCITTIDIPQGFEVETMPANASLKFTYGNYDVSYVYNKDKNQVIGTAKFVLNNNVIPASKYTEMQEYMDNIARAQNKKLVIRKKT